MSAFADRRVVTTSNPNVAYRLVATLLKTPFAVRLRGWMRDLSWIVKGATLENPPLPPKANSILFVCLGNICRSPFAERLAALRLQKTGGTMHCASAGIRTSQGGRSPEAACDVARRFGLTLDDHRPQLLTRDLMDRFDLVVVMEAAHFTALRGSYPHVSNRVVLLSLFDDEARFGYERYNIADPFAQPPAVFDACYRRIDRALARFLSALPGGRA